MINKCLQENATKQTQPTKRMPFKAEEDQKLRELVEKYGTNDWNLISSMMPNRSVRQCRERWNNNLSSKVLKDKWTPKEDELLKQKYYEFGPKWKLLEKFFPGRTSYNIRNRWSCIVRIWNLYSKTILQNQQILLENKKIKAKVQQSSNENYITNNYKPINQVDFPDFSSEFDNFDDDSFQLSDLFIEDNYFDCF